MSQTTSNSSVASLFRRTLTHVLCALLAAAALAAGASAQTPNPGSPDLVISQVYTRGGAAGASYNRDFVEIFNRGSEPVDLNNYGLHVTLDNGPIPASLFFRLASIGGIVVQPGRYRLIAFQGDGAGGQPLPTPDFDLGNFPVPLPFPIPSNLHPTSGTVALIAPGGSYTTCAGSTGVVDLVGYGPAAPCAEARPAGLPPSPTLTDSLQRFGNGCTDTNVNFSDLRLSPALPRNTGQPAASCGGTSAPSFFNFAAPQFDTHEADGHAEIVVTRTGDLSAPATVDYAITGGTAFERADYTTAAGRLRFAPGETQKTFDILITDDATQEQNETVELLILSPTGAGATGTRNEAVLVIHDNDSSPADSNPVDASAFFVRQHYHDFLNREPDAEGLQFWIDNIEACGADQQCREVKRIDTSAAFFLSIEFQRTGFLVYRLFKAALPETISRPRSLPRYAEFVRDTQEIRRGVVVGRAGWEQTLEANTELLLADFISRPEFGLNYPDSLLPNQYVNKLNAQAGSPLTPTQCDQLAAGMFIGTETRASVLRKVAESAEFTRRETNRAFVLMQYFGYLRRAPNDAPDTNFSGLDFWLGKLEEFDGDYRRAEMVKAFVSSEEYRARFRTPAP